jgi:hypothetical protein
MHPHITPNQRTPMETRKGVNPHFNPTKEAVVRAAQMIADVHAAAAAAEAAATQREHRVADFISKQGDDAHATTLASGASAEEAAQAAQKAPGIPLIMATRDANYRQAK